MGWFFNNTKKVAGRFFNFRVDQWIDYDNVKSTTLYIIRQTKLLFSTHKPSDLDKTAESFTETQHRLNLSEEDLKFQAFQYKRFAIFFLMLSFAIFLYMLFLIFIKHNYMGTCMTFSLTLFGLSQAMRHHFWYFQIQQRKLGCSFQEWWTALWKRGPAS